MTIVKIPVLPFAKWSSKFLILHVFNLILFINASICHFSDLSSICRAGIFRHLPLEFTGWTILVPTLSDCHDFDIL